MTDNESLFDNLRRRRVPQIAGMYIAAMWLVIELGDWVTERFALPGNLTSYVFIAMLVLLPAVLLVAYNHGAPGRDRWTRAEKVFVPINIALVAALLWFVTPALDVEAATEMLAIEDETGVMKEYEVARAGYHREVVGFFWENDTGDEALDWLTYGLPIMLIYDINRVSPIITAGTPIDSDLIMTRLREQGYEDLRGMPSGLAVQLTREQSSDALIVGRFSVDGDRKVISASVIDAKTGNVLETFDGDADNWMDAVDAVTAVVLSAWEITPADDRGDDPISEHFSGSLEAVRHFVTGRVAIDIGGNFPLGISEFDAAVSIDPAFAEARSRLSVSQYLSGNAGAARENATLALRNSYRLSTSSEFLLKANRYIFDGDYERGGRVLEIWTEVQPTSTRALINLAQISQFLGTPESLDKAIASYDRLLEIRPNDHEVYRFKSGVEQQRGNYDAAISLLKTYLDLVPGSGEAHGQLASLYQAQGNLDEAQAALEDAAILSNDPLGAEMGLIRLEARRGRFDEAELRLAELEGAEVTQQQKMLVLLLSAEIAMVRGQIARARDAFLRAGEPAKTVLPPTQRLMIIDGQRATSLLFLSRFDEAIEALDAVSAQLQPPLTWHLNISYSSVYAAAEDREALRRMTGKSLEVIDQLPGVYHPIITLEQAQLSIWDGDLDAAVVKLDEAMAMLGSSVVGLLSDNLGISELFVNAAALYLEAGATDKAKQQLEEVLLVYPSQALAKLVLARTLIAEGDEEGARLFLDNAIELWSTADEGFLYLEEARRTLAELTEG